MHADIAELLKYQEEVSTSYISLPGKIGSMRVPQLTAECNICKEVSQAYHQIDNTTPKSKLASLLIHSHPVHLVLLVNSSSTTKNNIHT